MLVSSCNKYADVNMHVKLVSENTLKRTWRKINSNLC